MQLIFVWIWHNLFCIPPFFFNFASNNFHWAEPSLTSDRRCLIFLPVAVPVQGDWQVRVFPFVSEYCLVFGYAHCKRAQLKKKSWQPLETNVIGLKNTLNRALLMLSTWPHHRSSWEAGATPGPSPRFSNETCQGMRPFLFYGCMLIVFPLYLFDCKV